MPKHKLRRNGFSPPLTRDQIVGAVNVFGVSATYYIMVGVGFQDDENALFASVCVHMIVFATTLALWFAAECIDPSTEGCGGLPCYRATESRYDRAMGKKIPGLDHHCRWLNTSIGRRNYGIFFSLICSLLVQYVVQIVVGIVLMVTREDDIPAWGFVLISIHELWSATCFYFDLKLVSFHIELMCRGITSYEWILRNAQEKTAEMKRRRAKRKQQQEEEKEAASKKAEDTRDNRTGDPTCVDIENAGEGCA